MAHGHDSHKVVLSAEDELERGANFKSVGYNPRFPNQNITRYCWANYIEFHRCVAARGGDQNHIECKRFKSGFNALCPNNWVETLHLLL